MKGKLLEFILLNQRDVTYWQFAKRIFADLLLPPSFLSLFSLMNYQPQSQSL